MGVNEKVSMLLKKCPNMNLEGWIIMGNQYRSKKMAGCDMHSTTCYNGKVKSSLGTDGSICFSMGGSN